MSCELINTKVCGIFISTTQAGRDLIIIVPAFQILYLWLGYYPHDGHIPGILKDNWTGFPGYFKWPWRYRRNPDL